MGLTGWCRAGEHVRQGPKACRSRCTAVEQDGGLPVPGRDLPNRAEQPGLERGVAADRKDVRHELARGRKHDDVAGGPEGGKWPSQRQISTMLAASCKCEQSKVTPLHMCSPPCIHLKAVKVAEIGSERAVPVRGVEEGDRATLDPGGDALWVGPDAGQLAVGAFVDEGAGPAQRPDLKPGGGWRGKLERREGGNRVRGLGALPIRVEGGLAGAGANSFQRAAFTGVPT